MPDRRGSVVASAVLALLALLSPWMSPASAPSRIGLLLCLAGFMEIGQGFRRTSAASQRAAWRTGGVTLLLGVLLLNAPWIAASALLLFLAGSMGLDGLRHAAAAFRRSRAGQPVATEAFTALIGVAGCAITLALGSRAATWAITIAAALRITATGFRLASAPVFDSADSSRTVVDDLALPDSTEIRELAKEVEAEELRRESADRSWIAAFAVTLFAVHLGRTGLDRSVLGVLTPGVAVLGDFVVAVVAAYAVIVPVRLGVRRLTRGVERRLWSWWLAAGDSIGRRSVGAVLRYRLRVGIRFRLARYSVRTAVSRGLQIGLPLAAVIAATAPFFGMSWYFDTENWAASVWNSWAEQRTDVWREAMVNAQPSTPGYNPTFAVQPAGVTSGDFSFVVIGDTGEGDASQQVLRDVFLSVVGAERVKFVVVSSDVVYPIGAMRDYEAKFWLPFKGTHKPVLAIPGNHDWYDALEAFNATFLKPEAARAAMRARIAADNGLTSTTDARIDELIAQASRLQREYGVPTQFQQGPFFQVQTDRFALIAIDTGVARSIGAAEGAWLRQALEQAKGKFTMALIGHPFYAGGHDTVGDTEAFAALRTLLRDHGVPLIMAGDTHDLEYYAETSDRAPPVHHFVNGGGGAYLSFGTALAWPDRPVTRDWAFYPSTPAVVAKIEDTTPWWKRPAWWWTREFHAWPYSPEWLSAMFDVNAAPYFQSFVEVVVESSAGRVRVIPYGPHGRLRWSDLQSSGTVRPAAAGTDDEAEWTIEMPRGPVAEAPRTN